MIPNLVYGFNIGDRQHIIDPDYLEEEFPDILQCATDVVKLHLVVLDDYELCREKIVFEKK